jgi:hypothetical protein
MERPAPAGTSGRDVGVTFGERPRSPAIATGRPARGQLTLLAADLRVSRAALTAGGKAEADVPFETVQRELVARLPDALEPGADASLRVEYPARPLCGLYFLPASSRGWAEAARRPCQRSLSRPSSDAIRAARSKGFRRSV